MKRGQIIQGTVIRTDFPNKGIVEYEEVNGLGEHVRYQIQVKGVLPGQTVSVRIKKARREKSQGMLLEVIAPAPQETADATCPYFGSCGGCNYQTLPYEEQLELKKNQVLDLIRPVCDGISAFVYDGILPSPSQWQYRNKMEFSFGDEVKDGPLTLGLHKKGSFHDILPVSGCAIVHPDFSRILDCVCAFGREKGLDYYHKNTHTGVLRHLLVRRSISTGELLVGLVTSSQQDLTEQVLELADRLKALSLEGEICGFLHILNDSMGDVVQSDETRLIFGRDWFMEEILGLKFRISAFSFFQTNTKGAEVLYEQARKYILAHDADFEGKTVFDLYSGTGTIAQIIAPVAGHVIGVEIVEEAVEAARENAAMNGLTNCEFMAGDVLKVIDEIQDRPDYIILDPPRDGIHPKALDKIIDYGVEHLVYISCKPTSLARDLVVLQERGYRVERMCNVDMFPNTVHVETVVLLSQQKPDDTIEIDLDLDELDATSAELKATYQEIKDYVLKEFGLKVSNLYISQVKRKCGIEVGENYNLPKSENARVPQCPKEKEEAIKAALKYFAMI